MKKFIITILLFAVVFFLFDKLFYVFIYTAPSKEVDKRLELLITGNINKDLIIIGSSRGARNIIANQIEAKTGLTSFNLSYPGSDIEFHEFLLKTLLKFNKPPKVILLPIDNAAELTQNETIKFRLDRLYPLVKYNYISQELVNRNEKNDKLLKYFMLHRICKSNFSIQQKHFTPLDTILPCGSMPI